MSSDYRIEKARRPVAITTLDAQRIDGEIFVQLFTRHRMGREEPVDVLNAPEAYFPRAVGGGDSLLIAKRAVREVACQAGAREDADVGVGARPVAVEVGVAGGPPIVGRLYIETPFDRPRLLDYLNRSDDRFLALHTDGCVRLVNREAILHIRQLD